MRTINFFIKLIIASSLCFSLYAQDEGVEMEADCIILEDENSIVCKYIHARVNYDKEVKFDWIEPDGTISRSREMTIPAGHGSVYDFRYIKGRTSGEWTFRVTDGEHRVSTKFTIK